MSQAFPALFIQMMLKRSDQAQLWGCQDTFLNFKRKVISFSIIIFTFVGYVA
jgi:hypothetical protein